MIAQVARAGRLACQQGTENRGLDARILQFGESGTRQLQGADPVDQESHAHSALRTGDHQVRDLAAEGVVAQNIRADIQPSIRPLKDR